MRKRISEISALTGRNLKEIVRDPVSLIFLIALPLVMEIMFYYLFHGMTSQFAMKYLAPGIVVFSEAFLALFSGLLIATDRNTSFLTRLYVTGAKSYQFIFGYALAMIPVALVQSVLFFLVGGIIDSSIFGTGMIFGILTSVFTSLFYIGLGILFGSVCSEKSVGGIASVAVTGQSLLSGMWFPLDKMSGAFITVMDCLPFKNATLIVMSALNGEGDILKPFLIVAAYTVAVFALAIALFRRKMVAG